MALSVIVMIGAANAHLSFSTSKKHFYSDSLGMLLKSSIFFLFLQALLRFILSPEWIQNYFAFSSFLNIRDIFSDLQGYALFASIASSMLIAQNIYKYKINKKLLFYASFFLIFGLASIYTAKILLGAVEGYKLSALTIEGTGHSLTFTNWMNDIFFATSLYEGPLTSLKYLLSFRSLILLGDLFIFIAILILISNVYFSNLLLLRDTIFKRTSNTHE